MQYIVANGPGRTKAMIALDAELGGDGASQNQKYTALDQMFGAEGTAKLYNPLALAAMTELIAGKSPDYVLGNLTAQGGVQPTAGYTEGLAALTPAWFALAQAAIAQFR
jgi:hypothetical protein